MIATCRLCGLMLDTGSLAAPANPKLVPLLARGRGLVAPRELADTLEWLKLGELMYAHLLQEHRGGNLAFTEMERVGVFSNLVLSAHFTGGASFESMKSKALDVAKAIMAELAGPELAPGVDDGNTVGSDDSDVAGVPAPASD
jgi:hypothetical protein